MRTRIEHFGIVLRRTQIREADQLVHILGEPLGKITAVARGAKNSKRRFFGGLDILDCGLFTLSPPREGSDLYSLEGISDRISWASIRKDLTALILASHCIELSDLLCATEDPECARLTKLLFRALRAIDSKLSMKEGISVVVFFSMQMLESSGYNILDNNEINLKPEIHGWLSKMKERSTPTSPRNDGLADLGLREICLYCERIIGAPLHAIRQLRGLQLESDAP